MKMCLFCSQLRNNAAYIYRVVQLNFTPEIEVFYMLFERPLSIFSMSALKQHIEYFHLQSEIQLDLPVCDNCIGLDI